MLEVPKTGNEIKPNEQPTLELPNPDLTPRATGPVAPDWFWKIEQPTLELPNPDLTLRATGPVAPGWFWKSGRWSIQCINALLSLIGKSFADFPRALDFGCGCGRMLLHLQDIRERVELHGVDIDADAIAWAQQHIPWASCAVNQGLPPLDFPDEHFDLVFNHSVFTHLDERYQDAWLIELERITKPGGMLVLSVSGNAPFAEMERSWRDADADPSPLRETLRTNGFLFIRGDGLANGPFPDFYHTAFHTPWYVFERWGSIFDIKAYAVRGDLDFQDLLLLRRRNQRVGTVACSKLALVQQRVAKLESALTKSNQEMGQWRTAAERSADDLEKVLASRSWRLTAPLRSLMARCRLAR